jgi:hypothetical protein
METSSLTTSSFKMTGIDEYCPTLTFHSEGEWLDWQPGAKGRWVHKGLKLIDFGRSIDMSLYPEGTKFRGDSHVDSFRCIEMQTGKPWTFQVSFVPVCMLKNIRLISLASVRLCIVCCTVNTWKLSKTQKP